MTSKVPSARATAFTARLLNVMVGYLRVSSTLIAQRRVDLGRNVVITFFDRAQRIGPHGQLQRCGDGIIRHQLHFAGVVADLQLVVVTEHRRHAGRLGVDDEAAARNVDTI